jgi:hypothetical protein
MKEKADEKSFESDRWCIIHSTGFCAGLGLGAGAA